MNAQSQIKQDRLGVFERRFEVVFERSYLRTPLNWKLRLWGPSVGGYGTLEGFVCSKHPSEERARLVGETFVLTGITPAHQTDLDRAAVEQGKQEFAL